MQNLKITLIAVDNLDQDNNYYLYEVENDNAHYYIARSDEDIKANNGAISYANTYKMLTKANFTRRELEIAQYLFDFLWNSDNGTNTCACKDIYEEDGFTQEEITNFIAQFEFDKLGVLEMNEDGDVEIYWDFFSCFDLNTCMDALFGTKSYTDIQVYK